MIALALQFVLSFAHVHDHVHAHDVGVSRAGFARTDLAGARLAPSRIEAGRPLPSGLADDDAHCTICFSSFLLSTSSVPDAPSKPALPEFGAVDRLVHALSDPVLQSRRAAFLSRAPPSA